MDVLLNEEEEMVKNAAREFLEGECSPSLARAMEKDDLGYPPALWHQMAQLGWLGLALPESFGTDRHNFRLLLSYDCTVCIFSTLSLDSRDDIRAAALPITDHKEWRPRALGCTLRRTLALRTDRKLALAKQGEFNLPALLASTTEGGFALTSDKLTSTLSF